MTRSRRPAQNLISPVFPSRECMARNPNADAKAATRMPVNKNNGQKNGARIVVDKRSLWQRKALKGSLIALVNLGRLSRIFCR